MKWSCMMAGNLKVGKTSLLEITSTGNFTQEYHPTKGVLHRSLPFSTNRGEIVFDVMEGGCGGIPDTALIMVDLQDRASWEAIPHYIQSIEEIAGKIPIVVCGNKYNQKENCVVDPVEIYTTLLKPNPQLTYFDIDTRTRVNIEKPFLFLWRKLIHPEKSYLELLECGLDFH